MQLSKVTDYAIRALLYLAIEKKPCRTIDIAESMLIPQPYLSKVLNELKKRGYVKLKSGVGGGVELLVDPAEISLLDVCEVMDGHFALNRCVFAPNECALSGHCRVHVFWEKTTNIIKGITGSVSIAQLAEETIEAGAANKGCGCKETEHASTPLCRQA